MKKFISLLAISAIIPQASVEAAVVDYGYNTGSQVYYIASNYNCMNYAVIEIPQTVASKYAGSKISGVKINCQTYTSGTTVVDNLEAFVADNITEFNALTSTTAKVDNKQWNTVTFDNPYTIEGNKAIYVGYKMKAGSTSLMMPFAFGNGTAIPYGDIIGYQMSTGEIVWEHAGDAGYGNLLVKAIIDGEDISAEGMMFMACTAPELIPAGYKFDVTGFVLNSGSNKIDGYNVNCTFDGVEVGNYPFTETVEPGSVQPFTLENLSLTNVKNDFLVLTPEVGGKKFDPYKIALNCTDLNKPRTVLIEEFSTASCGNCPAAQNALAKAISGRDDMITVVHHAGYGTDQFTTKYDEEYLWFYQTSTWAPAIMYDRTNFSEYGAIATYNGAYVPSLGPVMTMNGTDGNYNIDKFVNISSEVPAWIDVNIEYTYDPATRGLDVEVSGTPSMTFDSWTNPVVNIFLVERSAEGRQSGAGNNYTHRHIFRGAMTGYYGIPVKLEAGKEYSYKSSVYTVPTSLDAGNLDIVAFVSNYDRNDANKCQVLNAAKVSIDTPSTGGIDKPQSASAGVKPVNGGIMIDGDFSHAEIYSISGHKVAEAGQPMTIDLACGVYVVRIYTSNEVIVNKIAVE